jgi:TRAP-type mannitol/chloroaromatic compound transport system permease small subunit
MTRIWLKRIATFIDKLNEWVGRGVSWLTTLLVVLVCFDVITRYLMNDTQTWIMEMEWHLFALIFLFGAGYAFKHDRHVRVDLFYANFSARDKALVNLVGGILFLIPWCLVIIFVAIKYALISYKIGETSPDPGGLPARYLIKFSIALGMFFLLLQGVASVVDSALVLTGEAPDKSSEEENKKPLKF